MVVVVGNGVGRPRWLCRYDALKGGVTLPDIHIDTHVAEPIGHITLDLTDIQITGFTKPAGNIVLTAPSTAAVDLSNIQFQVSAFVVVAFKPANWC